MLERITPQGLPTSRDRGRRICKLRMRKSYLSVFPKVAEKNVTFFSESCNYAYVGFSFLNLMVNVPNQRSQESGYTTDFPEITIGLFTDDKGNFLDPKGIFEIGKNCGVDLDQWLDAIPQGVFDEFPADVQSGIEKYYLDNVGSLEGSMPFEPTIDLHGVAKK